MSFIADDDVDAGNAGPVIRRSRHHISTTLQLKSNSDAAADGGMSFVVDKFLTLIRFAVIVYLLHQWCNG